MSDAKRNWLGPFEEWTELTSSNATQEIGNCPHCGKDGHLYIKKQSHAWDCKRCGLSGGLDEWLRALHAEQRKWFKGKALRDWAQRWNLPAEHLATEPIGFDLDRDALTFLVEDATGKAHDLRYRRPEEKTKSTTGLHTGLWGAQQLRGAPAHSVVIICEGESDASTVRWVLSKLKTTTRHYIVLAAPGAGTAKGEWGPPMAGHDVWLLYDNDKPGDAGDQRMFEVMLPHARSVQSVAWPGSLPPPCDIRKAFTEHGWTWNALKQALRAEPRLGRKSSIAPNVPSEPNAPPTDPTAAVDWMNERHAVVVDSGKTLVLSEKFDPLLERSFFERSGFDDIKRYYLNRQVLIPTENGPSPRQLAPFWLTHRQRRTYRGLALTPGFDLPDTLNLWRGWAVEPKQGDWSLMEAHIADNLCSGDTRLNQYVRLWLARAVQRPSEQGEVALVSRGPRGTGKGIFGRTVGGLFGRHYLHLAQQTHLTGKFNAHLQDAIFLFVDEGFWAGDKQGESVIKTLVTEPSFSVEPKGRDIYMAKNMLHVFIASNNAWVVPAGLEERRFCVMDISEARMQDTAYFTALQQQMDNGGRAAMLYDLLHADLSTFEVRDIPPTAALLEQKLLSMPPVEKWWYQKLWTGRLLTGHKRWERVVSRDLLHGDYIETLREVGVSHKSMQTELGMQLGKLVPGNIHASPRRRDPAARGGRTRTWSFPTLAECRRFFDRLSRGSHEWPEVAS
jgi:hypothetical protein